MDGERTEKRSLVARPGGGRNKARPGWICMMLNWTWGIWVWKDGGRGVDRIGWAPTWGKVRPNLMGCGAGEGVGEKEVTYWWVNRTFSNCQLVSLKLYVIFYPFHGQVPIPKSSTRGKLIPALRLSVYRCPFLSLSLSLSSISLFVITVKFIQAQSMKAQKGSRDVALLFF